MLSITSFVKFYLRLQYQDSIRIYSQPITKVCRMIIANRLHEPTIYTKAFLIWIDCL